MSVILSIIAIIAPGFGTAFLKSRHDGKMAWRKLFSRWLLYVLIINLVIYGSMFAIGMRRFDFLKMSAGFRIKWLLLGLGLALFCACVGFPEWKKEKCLDRIRCVFPAALALTVTYAIFSPGALFLNNINEFKISFFQVAPIIFLSAALFLGILCLMPLLFVNETLVGCYAALLFGVAAGVYLQTNFLNPDLPALDGTPIDWAIYAGEGRINVLCWGVCLLLPPILFFFQRKMAEKGIAVLSWFFSAVQMVSLIVLIFAHPVDDPDNYGLSKVGEFTIGRQDNIVIFVVDTLQASVMEEYLDSVAYPVGALDDFTFFTRAVSGGSPTCLGLPTLMTGSEYEPLRTIQGYEKGVWEETALYDDLHHNGYDVRFFATNESLSGVSEREADNFALFSEGVRIERPAAFGVQLYKLTCFYSVPVFLKSRFLLTTETMTDLIKRSAEIYEYDDPAFYLELQETRELAVSYDKAFRLYHFRGVHEPYIMDENLQYVGEGCATEQQTLQGNMKEIYLYLDKMKQAGVYDTSTIIIAGDHGKHQEGSLEANPAVLIKSPQEMHGLAYSDAPIHFRNVTATMAMTMTEDYALYGPSVYDITMESDVERLHSVDETVRKRNTIDDAWTGTEYNCRFIVPIDPMDTENFQIWDPYQINRISYRTGKKIDFGENVGKAAQLDYRLYKEKRAAIASNELSICFVFEEAPKGELTFHFTYDRIYGKQQEVRVYAGGHREGTVICTPELSGNDYSVEIPQRTIKDGVLVLRLVFPNAVTPNQLDRENPDTRVLSVAFDSMWITEESDFQE